MKETVRKGFSRLILSEPGPSKMDDERPPCPMKSEKPVTNEETLETTPSPTEDGPKPESQNHDDTKHNSDSSKDFESDDSTDDSNDPFETIMGKLNEIDAELKKVVNSNHELSNYMLTDDVVAAFNRSFIRATSETKENTEKQLLKDFAGCNETYLKMIGEMKEAYSDSSDVLEVLDYMEAFSYEIENMLMRWNVMPFENDSVVSGEIRIVKSEPTDDESLNMRIKTTITRGYRYGNNVLLPQSAVVYKYEASKQESALEFLSETDESKTENNETNDE